MTNNNSQDNSNNHIDTLETRPAPSQDEMNLTELWYQAASERKNIFMSIEKKSEIPYPFELVGKIAEPIEKKSKELDRANSHWEIWRDKSNKTTLIFKVDGDDYELLAFRDMKHTYIISSEASTEILKATIKFFRMFN